MLTELCYDLCYDDQHACLLSCAMTCDMMTSSCVLRQCMTGIIRGWLRKGIGLI
jgi:hypothetical protein